MVRRTQPEALSHQLVATLAQTGPAGAEAIRSSLGVSQPTFSRLVTRRREDLLMVGRARRTRYAARRAIPGVADRAPLYEIDETGGARQVAQLHAIAPRGFYVEALVLDIDSGFHDDLPVFLHDLRPGGFLGRLVPRRHPELELPPDVATWSSDDCLRTLVHVGSDGSGALILGEKAFQLHLTHRLQGSARIAADAREQRYPEWAEALPGDSVGGEHPKFLAERLPGPVSVLVKFSPPVRDETSRRLADLLVCEWLALDVLRAHGQPAARAALLAASDRVFLEVERFDRAGAAGRRGLLSLAGLLSSEGAARGWSEAARRLRAAGRIDAETERRIRFRDWFGRLTAAGERPPENLSFFTRGTRLLSLAPAYGVGPKDLAPQEGRLPADPLEPALPTPKDTDVWEGARRAAQDFWGRAAAHPWLSDTFRALARGNAGALQALSGLSRLLPRSAISEKS